MDDGLAGDNMLEKESRTWYFKSYHDVGVNYFYIVIL